MSQTFTIPGSPLPDLEAYETEGFTPYMQSVITHSSEDIVNRYAKEGGVTPCARPVCLRIKWVEPNRQRTIEDIYFASRFIISGLVKACILRASSPEHIKQTIQEVEYDVSNPRIEVFLEDA